MLLQAPVVLPTPASPGEDRRRTSSAAVSWLVLLVAVIARMARSAFLTLLAVATLPSLLHWSSYAVLSGSMEPSMSAGDVVVGRPFGADEKVPVGRVMVFTDPGDPGDPAGRLLVHRVVEKRDDGTWTTAGDANTGFDTAPVERDAFESRAVLLVPAMARPYLWATEGAWLELGLATAGTTAVFLLAALTSRRVGRRVHRWKRYRPALVGALAAALVLGVMLSRADAAGAAFTSRTTSPGSSWTVPLRPDTYGAAVKADGPHYFWRMDEASGPVAKDASGDSSRNATYSGAITYGRPNVPRNLGASITFTGTQSRVVADARFFSNDNFTYEMWFRTTTKTGGKLLGLESGTSTSSATAERSLYMRSDGTLAYGDWATPNRVYRIGSPGAYNDGAWHHLVLTSGHDSRGDQYSTMYVDGAQVVASTRTTNHTDFIGHFRVGHGILWSTSGASTASFDGSVDEVAIYGGRLSATRVKAHYDARSS